MHRYADPTLLSRRGYEILRLRDIQPGERTLHRHEHYEVVMIWAGTMHYRVENRSYHLTNGDILLLCPGEAHQPSPEMDSGACDRLVLRIERGWMEQFRSFGCDPAACFGTGQPGGGTCLRFDDELTVRIGELLDRCLREYDSELFGSGMMADTAMVQAMILINRLFLRSASVGRRDRSGTLVSSVMEYINSHYAEDMTLDSLANRFFISKYHLSREFGRIVGISVHRYIVQKRLMVAKQMLAEGRQSSSVYQHCGFGDYSNFYRAFKQEYGISPKEYAASIRELSNPVG